MTRQDSNCRLEIFPPDDEASETTQHFICLSCLHRLFPLPSQSDGSYFHSSGLLAAMNVVLPHVEPPASPLSHYRLLSPTASVRVSPLCLGSMNFGDAWYETGPDFSF
ncbi:hypothetical protein E4U46_006158 [Claviceps purpurea]|nr:hypothetical protein E4U46_006158 [Claviceps purpurea]